MNSVHRQTLDCIVKRYEPATSLRHFGFRQQFICMVFAQIDVVEWGLVKKAKTRRCAGLVAKDGISDGSVTFKFL